MNPILEEDLEFLNGKLRDLGDYAEGKLLITGCAGFLGFYLLNYFCKYGKRLGLTGVIGLDNFVYGRQEWVDTLEREFPDFLEVLNFDISRDEISDIRGAKEGVTYVIHAASIASPVFYRQHPLTTIDGNVIGLRKLFEFYKDDNSLRGFLYFSSSEIYGDPAYDEVPTSEQYRGNVSCTGPRACYDEAKRFCETLCWIFANNHSFPVTVARPFNNFGPGMGLHDRRLPADLAKSIVSGEDICIFSDGTPTRTFCYISDAVEGYIRCLRFGSYDFFNIGNDRPEISVKGLAELFLEKGKLVFDYDGQIILEKSSDTNYLTDNPARRLPDISKARRLLNYNPTVELEIGVERYLRFLKGGRF